jgi:hemolysin activation/secretion protein
MCLKRVVGGVALVLACAGIPTATAQVPGIPLQQDPADRLLREQAERERQERLEQEPPEIAVPAESAPDAAMAPESIADPEPTFLVERILLTGNTVLPEAQAQRITLPFAGKRLGVNRINLLLRRLTQAFIESGFVTTRAYVGNQNLASGILEITVIPGRIEKYRYNGADLAAGEPHAAGVGAAFPTNPGQVLKLADLEQGVGQINRLRRNQAELQILPGQSPGGSVVAIDNREGDRFFYTFGVDNFGTATSGQTRYRAAIEAGNLTGWQEALSLTYLGSLDSNALLFAASLPAGYNTWSYSYSYSEFQNLIGDTALLFGNTSAHILAWNRVLGLSQRGKSSVDLSLGLRDARRQVNEIQLEPQQLAVLRAGYGRLQRFAIGNVPGHWLIDLGYSRGLNALGATVDAAGLPREGAHAQFDKVDLSATLVAQVHAAWTYRAAFAGQWAREALFSSEQIFIGGAGTVRGYAEGVLAGERGGFLRNEMVYAAAPRLLAGRLWAEPFAFLDGGLVQLVGAGKWQHLVGAGIGVRAAVGGIAAEVMFAQPLRYPSTLTDAGFRIHASLNATF